MQSRLPKLLIGTGEERSKFTNLLFKLVISFSRLLVRLDQLIDVRGSVFLCSGRRLKSSMMQRRNMELLAVIALNMGRDKSRDPGFDRMWDNIRKVRVRR